jgi:hypothetical protein
MKSEILRVNSDVLIVGIGFARAGRTIKMSIYETLSEEQLPIKSEVKYIQ